jgi:hypothetical protein
MVGPRSDSGRRRGACEAVWMVMRTLMRLWWTVVLNCENSIIIFGVKVLMK